MELAIYILCSILLSAAGIIIILLSSNNEILYALALSFIGSGLTSIAFTLIKYFEDKNQKKESTKMLRMISDISENITSLSGHQLVVQDVDIRCIFERHITSQFTEQLHHLKPGNMLHIDIMGLSLIRFYQEQLEKILSYKNLKIRIIIQDPTCESTQTLINQEGRNPDSVRDDIYSLIREISKLQKSVKANIELRLFQGYPSVTLTRINGAMYVRARFLNEAKDAPVFFEKYTEQYPRSFNIFAEYFECAWRKSIQADNLVV